MLFRCRPASTNHDSDALTGTLLTYTESLHISILLTKQRCTMKRCFVLFINIVLTLINKNYVFGSPKIAICSEKIVKISEYVIIKPLYVRKPCRKQQKEECQ